MTDRHATIIPLVILKKKLPTLYGFGGDVLTTVLVPVLAKAWLVYGICVQIFPILLVNRLHLVDDMAAIVLAVTTNSPSPELIAATVLLSSLIVHRLWRTMRAPSTNCDPTQPKLVDRQLPLISKGLRLVLEGAIPPVAVVLALVRSAPEFPSPQATAIEWKLVLIVVMFLLLLVAMEYLSRVHADPLELIEIRVTRRRDCAIDPAATDKGRIDQRIAHELFTERVRDLLAYTNQVLFVDAVFAIESETCAVTVGLCSRYADWTELEKEMLEKMTAALQREWKDRKFESQILGLPNAQSAGTWLNP